MSAPQDDPRTAQTPGVPAPALDVRSAYERLTDIARVHGGDEIKHLTRAYQAIAPDGGGCLEDLTRLVD